MRREELPELPAGADTRLLTAIERLRVAVEGLRSDLRAQARLPVSCTDPALADLLRRIAEYGEGAVFDSSELIAKSEEDAGLRSALAACIGEPTPARVGQLLAAGKGRDIDGITVTRTKREWSVRRVR